MLFKIQQAMFQHHSFLKGTFTNSVKLACLHFLRCVHTLTCRPVSLTKSHYDSCGSYHLLPSVMLRNTVHLCALLEISLQSIPLRMVLWEARQWYWCFRHLELKCVYLTLSRYDGIVLSSRLSKQSVCQYFVFHALPSPNLDELEPASSRGSSVAITWICSKCHILHPSRWSCLLHNITYIILVMCWTYIGKYIITLETK